MELNHEQCPLCGTKLSDIKFKEIAAKLRREEQEKAAQLAQAEANARAQIKQQYDREFEKQRQAMEKKVHADTEVRLKAIASERDAAAKKLKEAEVREVQTRTQAQQEIAKAKLVAQAKAKEEAATEIKKTVAARDELANRLKEAQQREAAAQKANEAEIEKQTQAAATKAKAEAAAQINKLASERDQAAAKAKAAEAREAAVRKQVAEEAEKSKLKELADQRRSLETANHLALLKQQSESNRERESWQKKVLVLQKQLEKKTANELGDRGQFDVLEALREHFLPAGDKVYPIQKGLPGADIVHEVHYKGTCCEKILIESKNRQDWKMEYATKLRRDQIEAAAEHAILATNFFPTGKKEMCIEGDVILISPARVVYVAQMLRKAIIDMHVKGLSMKERATKMTRLYNLIISDAYRQKLGAACELTEEILELDVKEKRDHDNTWKRRGSLAKQVQNALREAETDVAAIIEGTDHDEAPPPFGVKSAPRPPVASLAQGTI